MNAGELTPPRPDYDALAKALAAADADGFVHAGTAADADLQYLSGVADTADRIAFGYVDGTAVLALSSERPAPSAFPGRVERVGDGTAPSARIASLFAEHRDGGVIAAPRQLPHDAARYVQQAGFELTSTAAVADARAVKTDAELAAVARAADAATAGMERARERLAAATVVDGGLELAGEPLTASRLRRDVDAGVALADGQPAGNTCVATGSVADGSAVDDGAPSADDSARGLPAGEPIRIALAPRDPAGYHASLARTVTVEGSGGWERRAHVACEAARRVGVDAATAGEPAASVAEELMAELGAFGFDPGRDVGAAGTGIGLSKAEQPSLTGAAELRDGMVLSLTPSLSDGETSVGLADTVVVEGDEARLLTAFPTTMDPERN